MGLSRRRFVAAVAAGGATVALGAPRASAARSPVLEPGNPEFAALRARGYNSRFAANPKKIFVPSTADEVCDAVADSVAENLGSAVRSGGHCFEDFVDNDRTGSIIDLGRMRAVRWDEQHRAFSIEAGAELNDVYTALTQGWGVTIPAGICLGVGMGGHVPGGGYGPLSRGLGLVVDHLYGVEVVTVDANGAAETVVATKDGPNADLWWAHTGGGGGNFGVVTRFLFRSPGGDENDPRRALPAVPSAMLQSRLVVPFLSEDMFVRFLGNYLAFYEEHSRPGNRFAGLYAPMSFRTVGEGFAQMVILLDASGPGAEALFDEFVAAVSAGVTPGPMALRPTRASYADTVARVYYPKGGSYPRVKVKSAYLRRAYSTDQLRVFYRHLIDPSVFGETELEFLPFGGAVNATAPDATAMPARTAFMKMLIHCAWRSSGDDDRHIAWTRDLYREVYAATGGVPVPNEANAGCYINYPDPDLADPRWNTSGVPWHELYYGANYARLRQVKATWDPGDRFRHRLSIRA
ncbi:FAD-binding oxidoreductase [Nocardia arizonensis]|uniref:FAD-binding oxidoreductase n=1 Tax=Nocardia arizonensis TaxID=1141647 RepID=UPI0006D11464|nr:BBE domain-containing protein [Nocardia arizonensis]